MDEVGKEIPAGILLLGTPGEEQGDFSWDFSWDFPCPMECGRFLPSHPELRVMGFTFQV